MKFFVDYRKFEKTTYDYVKKARQVKKDIDKEVKDTVKEMAQKSHDYAPVLYYKLAPDIRDRRRRLGYATYSYGTNVPYGLRWEYEHRTRSGYFRKVRVEYGPEIPRRLSKVMREGFRI